MINFKRFLAIKLVLLIIFISFLISTALARAEILESIYFSPRFGSVLDAAIQGKYLYLVGYDGLAVMDMSSPQNPRLIKTIKSGKLFFNDIVIDGNYAYVTAGKRYRPNGKLIIFDVSNPDKIREIPNNLVFPEGPVGLVLENGMAYIGDYASGLAIVDVKDPRNPKIVSFFNKPQTFDQAEYDKLVNLIKTNPEEFKRLVLKKYGRLMFDTGRIDKWIKEFGPELIAKHLVVISTLGYENHCWWPGVKYPYAFVTLDGGGMSIVDITDPHNPKEVSYFNKKTPEGKDIFFNNVAIVGDYAFVTVDYVGFLILDISDVRKPKEVTQINPWPGYGWYKSPGHMVQVYIRGNVMYMTAAEDGLYVYDITNPRDPKLITKNDKSVKAKKGVIWGLGIGEPFFVFCYYNQCNTGECSGKKLSGGFEIFKMKK